MTTPNTPIDTGGTAFPVGTKTIHKDHYSGKSYPDEDGWEGGMSLRDWFAGQALAGLSAITDQRTCPNGSTATDCEIGDWRQTLRAADAAWCYAQADAMLAARKAVTS